MCFEGNPIDISDPCEVLTCAVVSLTHNILVSHLKEVLLFLFFNAECSELQMVYWQKVHKTAENLSPFLLQYIVPFFDKSHLIEIIN